MLELNIRLFLYEGSRSRAAELMADVGQTFQPHYRIFPIPQSEADLAGFTQNPGY